MSLNSSNLLATKPDLLLLERSPVGELKSGSGFLFSPLLWLRDVQLKVLARVTPQVKVWQARASSLKVKSWLSGSCFGRR